MVVVVGVSACAPTPPGAPSACRLRAHKCARHGKIVRIREHCGVWAGAADGERPKAARLPTRRARRARSLDARTVLPPPRSARATTHTHTRQRQTHLGGLNLLQLLLGDGLLRRCVARAQKRESVERASFNLANSRRFARRRETAPAHLEAVVVEEHGRRGHGAGREDWGARAERGSHVVAMRGARKWCVGKQARGASEGAAVGAKEAESAVCRAVLVWR